MSGIYDDENFFLSYSEMLRSKEGLNGAGEWECLESLIPDVKDFNILDLGCGFGWHTKYFIQHGAKSVRAVDVSRKMLTKAREMNNDDNILYIEDDIERTEIKENSYDLIFSSLVMHYVKDYPALVERIYKGLKKENLRDNMTNIELALNTLAEAAATEISKQQQPKGFQQNARVAKSGGSVAKAARNQLESQLGHSVISPINAKQVLAGKETTQIEEEKK